MRAEMSRSQIQDATDAKCRSLGFTLSKSLKGLRRRHI